MNKKTVTAIGIEIIVKESRKYFKNTKQWVLIKSHKKRIRQQLISKDKVYLYMITHSTRFASYLKTKERAKKDRRAIASPQMILRSFLYAIEYFHLEISKHLEGSTTSIGGDEKKAKIISTLNTATIQCPTAPCTAQGTEGATKWNECQSPQMLAAVHILLFSEDIYEELGLEPPTENMKLFQRIALAGLLLIGCVV